MAEQLTPQQRRAVTDRGGRLLVSAAAGSGKTKVLVDRLLGYLMDPVRPANLDDFLIITYTKAAAAELRGKIASKLAEKIVEFPDNRHLQQQMQRLYLTKISTVHAFCGDLLREYACRLDLSPDFRVGDENECRELRDTAMEHILDRAYEQAGEDPDFCLFVDTQGLGRDDRLVPAIVEKVYNSARCHMDSEKWLESCLAAAEAGELTDAAATVWGKYLMEQLKRELSLQMETLETCRALSEEVPEFAKVTALLADTVYQLRVLREAETWDQVLERKNVDYGRMTFPRKHGAPELAEQLKAARQACKDGLGRCLKNFTDSSEQIRTDLQQAGGATRGLMDLVHGFAVEYDRLKRQRRVLDFSDLEHRTLDLLLGKSRSGPTKIAHEVGRRFREVLVDEYQDSNAVQDAIFSVLTEEQNNCFMVGDVKQSIYQFRLADPEIFLEKYRRYVPAEQAGAGEGRKVLLSKNFRSGGPVLEAVNHVFSCCMSPEVGGLDYGPEEALQEGFEHEPLGEPEVEFHAIDVREDTYEEEAAFTARRIAQLTDGTHLIRSGDGLRPIEWGDVVILLRSPGSVGQQYMDALQKRGIPCSSGGGQNLLQTAEVMTLRSLLQIISNPRQDIPLASVLASPIFGFSADDLAALRSRQKSGPLYDAVLADTGPGSREFARIIGDLRRASRMNTLSGLLELIFSLTHVDSIYGAMAEGKGREANLRTFFQLAVDFEAAGSRDLRQFLEHLDAMEASGLMTAGEQQTGCVTLMSIHKSKGLEFPVVFLCGLGRKFNQEDLKAQVLCHRDLGLGLSAVDREKRIRYPTLARRAIAVRTWQENLSEELRVLYVAMTRARDRLIMTYAQQNLPGKVSSVTRLMDLSSPELLTKNVSCPGEWVLQSALRRTEAGELFALGGRPRETQVSGCPWLIQVDEAEEPAAGGAPADEKPREEMPPEALEKIARGLSFRYAHEAATRTPSKQTATQRKGREKDEEIAENAAHMGKTHLQWRKPAFLERPADGRAYGSAVHLVMQYVDYSRCGTESGIREELSRLREQNFITEEQEKQINPGMILNFFRTELGNRLRTEKNVLREFKFSVLDDARDYGEHPLGEQVLLQGVVDCALVDPDGLIILDFKTDFVRPDHLEETARRYRLQVETYASALSRIYQLPVKASYLYFFHLGEFFRLT